MRSLHLVLLLTAGGFLSLGLDLAHGKAPVQDSGDGTLSGQSEPQALRASQVISGIVLDPSGAGIVGLLLFKGAR